MDRDAFASAITQAITDEGRIQVVRQEVPEIPADRPVVVATGIERDQPNWTRAFLGRGFFVFTDGCRQRA